MPKKSTGYRYPEQFKAEVVRLAYFSPEKSIRQLAYQQGIADQTLPGSSKPSRSRRARRPEQRRARGALVAAQGEQGPEARKGDLEKAAVDSTGQCNTVGFWVLFQFC
jgi:transposase-like protein